MRDELQFLDHELWTHELAIHDPGFADARDGAVDDDARVENSVAPLGSRGAEQRDEPRGLEPLAVLAAKHETEIRQDDQNEAVEKLDPTIVVVRPEETRRDRASDREADGAAHAGAEHTRDRRLTQAAFEQHDERRQHQREGDVGNGADRQRLKNRSGVRDGGYEQCTSEREPSHGKVATISPQSDHYNRRQDGE